jgi:hypothetical protein
LYSLNDQAQTRRRASADVDWSALLGSKLIAIEVRLQRFVFHNHMVSDVENFR